MSYIVGDHVQCQYGSIPCIELKEGLAVFQLPDGGTVELPNSDAVYVDPTKIRKKRVSYKSSPVVETPRVLTDEEQLAALEAELAQAKAKVNKAKAVRSTVETVETV